MPTEPVEGKDGKAGAEKVAVPEAVAQVPPVEELPPATGPPAEKKGMVRWIILAVVVVLLIIGAVFALRFIRPMGALRGTVSASPASFPAGSPNYWCERGIASLPARFSQPSMMPKPRPR
jgi:hypothetical protein